MDIYVYMLSENKNFKEIRRRLSEVFEYKGESIRQMHFALYQILQGPPSDDFARCYQCLARGHIKDIDKLRELIAKEKEADPTLQITILQPI
jgi:hypothetical protein